VRVIRHETALGFAAACNTGAAAATGEFLILLNNDTIPTAGWLAALVNHARRHPDAAVIGSKLLFPNDTIQHAGVVFGLDSLPHHIYAGFPADHSATTVSRRFQVVTAACALFRREPWQALGGLSTDYHNGWEDVDYCLRAGESGYEVHYCAESVLYHFESATRDLFSAAERENQAIFNTRWREKIAPDDFGYYWIDGLFSAKYGARYPIRLSVSPLLAGITVGDDDRLADRLLYDRARQVMILLRNNIVLNVRVQEAEARVAEAERRLNEALQQIAVLSAASTESNATSSDDISSESDEPPGEPAASDETANASTADPSPSPALPHRLVGMVESPGKIPEVITDGILTVSGWTLTETGDATIEVFVNGQLRGTIPYGDSRPDANELYPGFPAGENCGFLGEIEVGDLPDGMHIVTIRISTSDGGGSQLTTEFEVDNHAFETGRVIGRLDLPVRGNIYIAKEIMPVSGWMLAPSGIRAIESFVDGEPRGRIGYGTLRPDIGKRRRQYPNADHCGFFGTVPLHGLEGGSHELLVRATANDGRVLELPTRIEVDTTVSIDAGLPVINRHYRAWLDRQHARDETLAVPESDIIMEALVPLEGDCEEPLAALATSMHAQTYPRWRMTLLGSCDLTDSTRRLAQQLAVSDPRIVFRDCAGNEFASAANDVLATSEADWITILRPGVILSPVAFACIVRSIEADPDATLIYSDDDRVDPKSAERWNPFFKPDWSPDLLLAMNYLGPLTLFQRQAALAAGGIRPGFEGAEGFDLALRITDGTQAVRHVPEVLVTAIETAPPTDEPWHASDWHFAEARALEATLARRGIAGDVERGLHPGSWRVRYAFPDLPGVTAVIPTGGKLHLLRPCLEDLIERTDYPNLEILLIDNSRGTEVANLVEELLPRFPNLRRVADSRSPFNYSALVNASLPHVTTPQLLMLNDDITVIDPGWLRAMVEHAQRPDVGIVGAKLLYPDDTIQHAGVVLGPFAGSIHVFKRLPGDEPGFFDLPDVVRNCSAVTFACALIDRAVFDTIGGMDEINFPVAFNDTDFCLRAREAGFEVIYTPHASLYHHESVTKTVIAHPSEITYLRERWGHVIAHDPYYNPNLTRKTEDARLNMERGSVA
jgi:GT2 family glycosyltransferase